VRPDLVTVAFGAELVLRPLDGHPRIGELAIRGEEARGILARHRPEARFVDGVADPVAGRATGSQSARPAHPGAAAARIGGELVVDLPEVIARLDALVSRVRRPGGPAGVQRIERAFELQRVQQAVAVVFPFRVDTPAGATELLIAKHEAGRVTVDVALARERHLCAGPEQVQFLQFEARRVVAALAPERQPRVQRPDILHFDFHVDLAVMPCHRPDPRIPKVSLRAQQSRRFIQEPTLVGLPGDEQELVPDGVVAGLDVQPVRQPEQRCVFFRKPGVEQIADDDRDLAHDRAGALQFGVGWNPGRTLVQRC
jgi:hypothetical protein